MDHNHPCMMKHIFYISLFTERHLLYSLAVENTKTCMDMVTRWWTQSCTFTKRWRI